MNGKLDGSNLQRSGCVIGLGMGLGGAGLLGLAVHTIYDFAGAVAGNEPIIFWDTGGWTALPTALALLALTLAVFIGRHEGPDVEGPRSDAIRRLLVVAVCLLPFVIVLPFGAQWLAGQHLESRGYNECISGVWVAVGRVPDVPATPAACRGLSS
jgi:hypothetical protein